MRLFVEDLAVPVEEDSPSEQPQYDDSRKLNITADGKPYVLHGLRAGTITMTKVSSENDDADAMGTVTRTAVGGESDDRD